MDTTFENAQKQLRIARTRLKDAEGDDYCCQHSQNYTVGRARKQVKRWETWLADRSVLAGDDEDVATD